MAQAHQHKLEAAQNQRTRMASEMEGLKARLDESQRSFRELRRAVRVAETANQSSEPCGPIWTSSSNC